MPPSGEIAEARKSSLGFLAIRCIFLICSSFSKARFGSRLGLALLALLFTPEGLRFCSSPIPHTIGPFIRMFTPVQRYKLTQQFNCRYEFTCVLRALFVMQPTGALLNVAQRGRWLLYLTWLWGGVPRRFPCL